MKNLTLYSIFLLILTSCFSCVKEADILTESEPEIIIQEGETRLLNGIVKDTTGNLIPHASVKLIFDDLELIAVADENGEWNQTVPNSLTEGFIVANKVEYSKSIQRFNNTLENRVADIYLIKEQSNMELDLSFNQANLKIVIGKVIDGIGNPIPNVNLLLMSLLANPQNEFEFNGFESTRSDGTFEIIYEDNGFISTTLYTLFSNVCGEVYSFTLIGQEVLEDLGDLELAFENKTVFLTSLESDGSSCYENVSTLAYHYDLEAAFQPVSYDQPLGEISVEYCPNENSAFYVGVESEDDTHFNGLFISESEIEPSYTFDICTPSSGDFLELTINGTQTLYEENLIFVGSNTVISADSTMPLTFTVLSWISSSPIGGGHPRYQIGELSSFSLLGDLEVDYNNLDHDRPFNFVNIVQDNDSFFSGIAQAKLLAEDGNEVDIFIRFRVRK